MITTETITALAEKALTENDQFLVDVVVSSGNKITVVLDSDTSVNIDDCVQISRFIEGSLDREAEDFELSVYSAGLDQPLKLFRQYKKYLNKEISVLRAEGKKLHGTLTELDEQNIKLLIPANKKKKIEEQLLEIPFEEIKEAKVVISFKKK